jgi:signal transduction histidine kinase
VIKSLSGRVFLVLLVGIVASACLTLWIALSERQNSLMQSRDAHYVERAEQLVMAIDAMPAENRVEFLRMLPRLGIRIGIEPDLSMALPNKTLNASIMADRLGPEFQVTSLPFMPCPIFGGPGLMGACETFAISLHDGTHISLMLLPPRNPLPPVSPDFYQYLLIFLACIAGVVFLVTRMVTRPLRQLSQAALDLGNDINHPPLAVAGASELRHASSAFNAMQARIRNYIDQRTHMLAAITHDLQTPLTRLRLRIEKVSDAELRDRLISDLSAMQDMVREGLSLARSMDSAEHRQPMNLDSLLDSAVSDAADAGQPVQLHGKSGMSVRAQPQALLRCVNNLIDNAIKYGRFANVTVQHDGNKTAIILVRDGGPGMPPEELEKVFTPFYRIETSRSRESGGTGLGLTIARNICEQHGGTLTLRNHPDGGLEASLRLPGRFLGK